MNITLTIPEELAAKLQETNLDLPQILELGLRRWNAAHAAAFHGLTDVLESLAALPTPEEVLALRPSETLQRRIDELLQKNRSSGLTAEEQREWEQFAYVEHLVRLAKTMAVVKLSESAHTDE